MKMPWTGFSGPDEHVFWMTADFIVDRLCERSTLDWALELTIEQEAERRAVAYVLNDARTPPVEEPWYTAWSLLEASWQVPVDADEGGVAAYIHRRLESGERSSELAGMIVDIVEPRLEVKPPTWWSTRNRGRPKEFEDLVRVSLTSGQVVEPSELGLSAVEDEDFLRELATDLDASLRRGLALGRRIGWDGGDQLWRLGSLNRLERGKDGDTDADSVNRGIAPVAKLLCGVAFRLAETEQGRGKLAPLLLSWRACGTALDVRLWAALARRPDAVEASEVAEFLSGLDDIRFWDVQLHPEVALLRAQRYEDLDSPVRSAVARRLRRRPPRNFWRRALPAEKVNEGRDYWAARELQRIALCGGVLPVRERAWLQERLKRFRDLATMGVESGFLEGVRVVALPSVQADVAFDELRGEGLLRALEIMLSEADDSASGRSGRAWLRAGDNLSTVAVELANSANGAAFPRLLVWVLRFHGPKDEPVPDAQQAAVIMEVLRGLPAPELESHGVGVAEWMGRWCRLLADGGEWAEVWLRVWPSVVVATNAIYQPDDLGRLDIVVGGGDDESEPRDDDTRNTPVASLVDVFLAACRPGVKPGAPNPFERSALGRVRDALVACEGQALLIVRHRLLSVLEYFLQTDRAWAEVNLVAPLYSEDAGRLALWRAVATPNLRRTALSMIGEKVAQEATNEALGHRTRTGLVFSLVVESLFAKLDNREPAVDAGQVQQVLRLVDGEIRSEAADTVVRFVRDVSRAKECSSADVFESAAAPFLRDTWPLERTLATVGVSRALAKLPARSGTAFAEAVTAIERFMVPFECHSLTDYGLYGTDGGEPRLNVVDDERKGLALLRLLDLTVGTSPSSVVPFDLRKALDRIRSVNEDLGERAEFRRLWSLSSR